MWKIGENGILLVKRTPPPTPHLPFPNILDLSAHLHYILDLSRMCDFCHRLGKFPSLADFRKGLSLGCLLGVSWKKLFCQET